MRPGGCTLRAFGLGCQVLGVGNFMVPAGCTKAAPKNLC